MELTGGTVGVRTKSGCTLRCTYCVVPWIEALNLRPWDDIRAELRRVVDLGLGKCVFIADGEFNLPNAAYAIDLSRRIEAEFGRDVAWRCFVDCRQVTDELVDAMARANCVRVSITARLLLCGWTGWLCKTVVGRRRVDRDAPISRQRDRTAINVLFGGPRETVETTIETAEHSRRFSDAGAQLTATIGLRVYPGTPLARMVKNPRFSKYYHPLRSYPWLGVFCSPMPRDELANVIQPMLPPGRRIAYTSTMSEIRQGLLQRGRARGDALDRGPAEGARIFRRSRPTAPPTAGSASRPCARIANSVSRQRS